MGGADDLAQKAPKFFVQLGQRFANLGKGVGEIGLGLGQELQGVIVGSINFIDDMIDLITTLIVFGGSNIICFIQMLGNFKDCFIYYVLQIIGSILYLPVIIIIWICSTLKIIDLQKYVDKFWKFMEVVDQNLYKYTKLHIVHFPKSVREKCFVCKRLKPAVIVKVGTQIAQDFTPPDGEVIKPFADGINNIIQGGKNVGSFFEPW